MIQKGRRVFSNLLDKLILWATANQAAVIVEGIVIHGLSRWIFPAMCNPYLTLAAQQGLLGRERLNKVQDQSL